MVWQMLSLDSFTRQFMVLNTNQSLSEAEKNKKAETNKQFLLIIFARVYINMCC